MNNPARAVRLLMVGPQPPPVGGASVSFQILAERLAARSDVSVRVVRSAVRGGRMWRTAWDHAVEVACVARRAWDADVIALHCNTSGILIRGLVVRALGGLARKPVVLRVFGGDDFRAAYRGRRLRVVRWVVWGAACYLAQTKQLVDSAASEGMRSARWFPTSRSMARGVGASGKVGDEGRSCRRFVYLGHVREEKGVAELVGAAGRFTRESGVTVDFYGPLVGGFSAEWFEGHENVRYAGTVAPEDVEKTLENYDALVLPTHYEGEGYPGVIMEAYAAGLPVVCTRWRALPEIVDARSGLLVEPRDPGALYEAMARLCADDDLYGGLAAGATARAKEFDADTWGDRFAEICIDAVRRSTRQSRQSRQDTK